MSPKSTDTTVRAATELGSVAAPRRTLPPLLRYILVRAGVSILLLFGVTIVTFTLTNLVPADPVQAALGERAAADPEIVAKFRTEMGLDKPLIVQYFTYLYNVFHGDLGVSNQTRVPVAQGLLQAFPATAELALVAMTFAIIAGLALGARAAVKRNQFEDQAIRVLSLIGLSVPTFWLALIAYYFLFYRARLLPGSGRLAPSLTPPRHITGMYVVDGVLTGNFAAAFDAFQHLLLPASVLALFTLGLLTRFTRSSVLEVLDMDYIKAARAKGLPSRTIMMGYVMRGALVPIITIIGLAFGSLLSGTVLVEKIFAWHGLGEYAFLAATKLDLPAVMGVGLVVGMIYIGINFVVDILYGVIDPRVRVK